MRNGGLEPPSLSTHVPETCASTNSASSAFGIADTKCAVKIAQCQSSPVTIDIIYSKTMGIPPYISSDFSCNLVS